MRILLPALVACTLTNVSASAEENRLVSAEVKEAIIGQKDSLLSKLCDEVKNLNSVNEWTYAAAAAAGAAATWTLGSQIQSPTPVLPAITIGLSLTRYGLLYGLGSLKDEYALLSDLNFATIKKSFSLRPQSIIIPSVFLASCGYSIHAQGVTSTYENVASATLCALALFREGYTLWRTGAALPTLVRATMATKIAQETYDTIQNTDLSQSTGYINQNQDIALNAARFYQLERNYERIQNLRDMSGKLYNGSYKANVQKFAEETDTYLKSIKANSVLWSSMNGAYLKRTQRNRRFFTRFYEFLAGLKS